MKAKGLQYLGIVLVFVGVLMFSSSLIGFESIVSDGTVSLNVHVVDADGNPIEGMSVWAFPFYDSYDIPHYPPPVTYPEYLTNANGDVEIVLTYLNTQPVPSTENSVCSQITFYADGYQIGSNFAVQYGYLYAIGFHTVLNGQTSSLNAYFSVEDEPTSNIIPANTPFSFYLTILGIGTTITGFVVMTFESKKGRG